MSLSCLSKKQRQKMITLILAIKQLTSGLLYGIIADLQDVYKKNKKIA